MKRNRQKEVSQNEKRNMIFAVNFANEHAETSDKFTYERGQIHAWEGGNLLRSFDHHIVFMKFYKIG